MGEILKKIDGDTVELRTTLDLEEGLEEFKEEIGDLEKKLETIDKNIESYPYEVPEVVRDYREALNNFLSQSKRFYEAEIELRHKEIKKHWERLLEKRS